MLLDGIGREPRISAWGYKIALHFALRTPEHLVSALASVKCFGFSICILGHGPGMTRAFKGSPFRSRYLVHHELVGDTAQRGFILDRLDRLSFQDRCNRRRIDH